MAEGPKWITAAEAETEDEIKVATVTLTNDQIKTLRSLGSVIIAPTEVLSYSGFPTQLFVPFKVSIVLDATAGAYGGVDPGGAVLVLWCGTGFDVVIGVSTGTTTSGSTITGITDDQAKQYLEIACSSSWFKDGNLGDNGLLLAIQQGGDLTDGNSANTMNVSIYYTVRVT